MTASLREALDRTIRMMRDELIEEVDDACLLRALTDTRVVIFGDAQNLASHAAQCAYITAAMLMARSGHTVHLAAPDVPLVGPQPPLAGERLVSALLEVGSDMLPDTGFSVYPPSVQAQLAVGIGDSPLRYRARRSIALNAGAWDAWLGSPACAVPWAEPDWPIGAIAAGMLASVEAFKAAMHGLRAFAKDPKLFDALFAATDRAKLELAPAATLRSASLEQFDFVSGGAITNAALYVLARLPNVAGHGRIIEPQHADTSNLNRYPLLRRSAVGRLKAETLAALMAPHVKLLAVPRSYEGGRMSGLAQFAPKVLVGTDDIPTRWKVQAEKPKWLGVGATTHWAAMASFHETGLACAHCLHPRDDIAGEPIPTIAFVSFLGGLMLSCYLIRTAAREEVPPGKLNHGQHEQEQYTYMSPLRPEQIWRSPVAIRADCPTCQSKERVRAA